MADEPKRRRRYTEAQKKDALQYYKALGPTVASQMCGIPKDTITQWAADAHITTDVLTSVRSATLTVAEQRRLKREVIRTALLERIADALARMSEPHIDFKGAGADQVTYPVAPAAAFRDYANSFAVLMKEYRLETGEATDRPESTTRILDTVRTDHERQLLQRAIDLGLSLEQGEAQGAEKPEKA